jgi:hypothetical protein
MYCRRIVALGSSWYSVVHGLQWWNRSCYGTVQSCFQHDKEKKFTLEMAFTWDQREDQPEDLVIISQWKWTYPTMTWLRDGLTTRQIITHGIETARVHCQLCNNCQRERLTNDHEEPLSAIFAKKAPKWHLGSGTSKREYYLCTLVRCQE